MDKPTRILTTLDAQLDHRVELVLFGRASICLGFDDAPREVAETLDVDAILPVARSEIFNTDFGFWEAVRRTNELLDSEGLYVSNLFEEHQIILRSCWYRKIVPLTRPRAPHLDLYRPATIDLILTKMMRADDPQDFADITFLIRHDQIAAAQLEAAFASARGAADVPDVWEIFERAKPRVLALAQRMNAG